MSEVYHWEIEQLASDINNVERSLESRITSELAGVVEKLAILEKRLEGLEKIVAALYQSDVLHHGKF